MFFRGLSSGHRLTIKMAMEMNNLRPGLLGVNAPGRAPSSTTDASCVASADGRSEEDSEILREEERYQSRSVAGLSRLPKEEDLLKPYQVTAIIANRMIGSYTLLSDQVGILIDCLI